MLIPNTPRYGAGSTPGNHQAFYEAVQEAARTVDEKLSTKVCLKYKMVTGLLEPGALRSAHREWRIDFLMIISSEVDEKGKFVSVVQKQLLASAQLGHWTAGHGSDDVPQLGCLCDDGWREAGLVL